MTRLPFFKFNPSIWLTGDITMESFSVQGVFINICAYYWQRECTINEAWLKQRLSSASEEIDMLIKKGFLLRENDNGDLTINFLNEQHIELTKLSETRVNAGRIGGQASVKQRLKKSQPNLKHLKQDTDKEQDTYRAKNFQPPNEDEVISFLNLKAVPAGAVKQIADSFISFYGSKGWMVGKTKMRDWKLSCARSLDWDSHKKIIASVNRPMQY